MEIDAKAKTCPICDYEFPGISLAWKLLAVLLVLLFLYLIFR
jgi:hypothetical protein